MSNVQPLSQGESLAVGDQSDQVEELQRKLQHIGYYQGQVDGYYGETLEAAVREFQRASGHEEDGRAGAEMWHEVEHQAASSGYGAQEYTEQSAETAETAAIQVGQLSEDGAWQWNGTEWVAAGGDAQAPEVHTSPGGGEDSGHAEGNGQAGEGAEQGGGQGANHPALDADPSAEIPKLSQDDFHMAIADTMTVHAGENA